MKGWQMASAAVVLVLALAGGAWAVSSTQEELAQAEQWVEEHFASAEATGAFSLVYDGKPSATFLAGWKRAYAHEVFAPGAVRHVLTLTDPETGLELVYTALHYTNCAAVELLLELRNTGAKDTPILESVRPLDAAFDVAAWPCTLHRSLGESNSEKSFAPVADALGPEKLPAVEVAPRGGRSSDENMPFFNLQGRGGGVVVAIGWAGQWTARFACSEGTRVRAACGQQDGHLLLHPGEKIRTPRILLQFWRGDDALRANNLFRQWMLAWNLPRRNGEIVLPPICASVTQVDPDGSYEGPHVRIMKPLAERGIEVFWSDMDPQQWYPRGFPEGTGTWEPDPVKYPNGLGPVGQAAHAAGLEYLLWFEPERVASGTRIEVDHPEWITRGDHFHLFRLDLPEARTWITDYIDKQVAEADIEWIRWDFNIEPLGYWRKNDAPDRQGMTEIRHVEGLYAMWEDLAQRHPGLMVDICASGGRRIDFETLRYGLPLWHSDMQCFGAKPAADQLQNGGLALWLPLHGCGNFDLEPSYTFRSAMTAGNILIKGGSNALGATPDPEAAAAVQRTVALFKKLRPLMLGDFYPLFPHDASETVWYGFQYHRPDLDEGFALVFRRQDAPNATAEIRLHALTPGAHYTVTYEDNDRKQALTAEDLAKLGVEIPEAPGSAIVYYCKAEAQGQGSE